MLFLLVAALVLPVTAMGQRAPGAPGTGNPADDVPVPWRFVEKDVPAVTTPVTLYWLPASNVEMDRSLLLSSKALLDDSARCVTLLAIVPHNTAIEEKLGVGGKLPAAVLVDAHGAVIRRLENTAGILKPAAVEQMVSAELSARDEAMFHNITEAKKKAGAGDKAAAIDLYRKIWDDRCLFPLAGQEAQAALKTLGVKVEEVVAPSPPDPNLKVTNPTKPPHS